MGRKVLLEVRPENGASSEARPRSAGNDRAVCWDARSFQFSHTLPQCHFCGCCCCF